MGFTNVVWESRNTTQLARDLTEGPGPASVGEAGAAWVRVANEFAAVSADYNKMVERLKTSWESDGSAAAVRKLEVVGKWLQDMSLAAAGNGQRGEEAAVANTEAVLAMPSVSEAVEAKAVQDMMASLAVYNGAILNGNFAEFDEAARADHASAAAVMRQYEDAVAALAQPWEPPLLEQASPGATPTPEQASTPGGEAAGAASGGGGAGAGATPMPLAAWTAPKVNSSADAQPLHRTAASGGQAGAGGMAGGGYAPVGAHGRGDGSREYESTRPAGSLEGSGEPVAGLSDSGSSWQPVAQPAEFTVTNVSWGPTSAVFDDLVPPEQPEPEPFADAPGRTLEQVSDRWVSPPVIGADGEVRR